MRSERFDPLIRIFDPHRLPLPASEWDLADQLQSRRSALQFETLEAARNEDLSRSAILKTAAAVEARELGEWLHEQAKHRRLALTLSSAVYMREVRRRLLGELLSRFEDDDEPLLGVHLLHPGWRLEEDQLEKFDPSRLKTRLRRCLFRAGVTSARGKFFAGLHGEYDGTNWYPHFHGIASGKKAVRLRKLSGKYGFVPVPRIRRPVVVVPVCDLKKQLSYCLQGFWPYRPRFINDTGEEKRARQKRRLPNAQLIDHLLWLSKQKLSDQILFEGIALSVRIQG